MVYTTIVTNVSLTSTVFVYLTKIWRRISKNKSIKKPNIYKLIRAHIPMNGTYGNRCYCSLFTRQRRGPVNPWIRTYWNINARYRRTRKNKVENWVRYRPVARKQRLFARMNKTRRTALTYTFTVLFTCIAYLESVNVSWEFSVKKSPFSVTYSYVYYIFVKISTRIFISLYVYVFVIKIKTWKIRNLIKLLMIKCIFKT